LRSDLRNNELVFCVEVKEEVWHKSRKKQEMLMVGRKFTM